MTREPPARFNITEHFVYRSAREHPHRTALLTGEREFAYQDVAELTSRAAGALRADGCQPGERVLLVLPDGIEFVAAFFGAAQIGAVAVPVNSTARAADYDYYLRDCGARRAIVHAASWGEFGSAAEAAALEQIVVGGEPLPAPLPRGAIPWRQWLERSGADSVIHATSAADSAFFLYTSGSGGRPKAAVHRHRDMQVTSRNYAQGVLGLRADDRTFSLSKLFFAYGLGNGMYFPFAVGASSVLLAERPRPQKVAETLLRHRPTVFFAVPTFYAALLHEVEAGLAVELSSVRLAVSAGEALPAELFERFRRRFGLEILDGIGSTEMLHMFISGRPGKARAGSCGIEVPNCEARIVDENAQPVARGEIGNLWVKSESAFAGYWNKPELTARTLRGDWVVTGDKFFCDPDGYFHYCGRSDDMMKVAGMWVAPAEVENALLGHPAVVEAAVVGVEADGLVHPEAYVVLGPDHIRDSALANDLRAFVRGRLPGYKTPAAIHFLDELPKTATGKVQRYRLRDGR